MNRTRGVLGVLPYLLDIVVPVASYYGLTASGLSTFWALVAGGLLTAGVSVVNTIRRGKLDKLGLLVIVEIVLGLVLDLVVHDARLTLARASLFIAVGGAWVLGNAFTGRPVTVDGTKPFALRKGGQVGVDAFEWLAANSPRFMRVQRVLSVTWGTAFLAYAAVRVVVIYSVTVSEAVWFNEIPGVLAVVVGMAASARWGKVLETLVHERMAASAALPNPGSPEERGGDVGVEKGGVARK
jgi:hypothetical protein